MGHYDDLYDEKREAEEVRARENQKKLEETPHFKLCRKLQQHIRTTQVSVFAGTFESFDFLLRFMGKDPMHISQAEINRVRAILRIS